MIDGESRAGRTHVEPHNTPHYGLSDRGRRSTMSSTLAELEEALATYKTRMASSNRAFWQGRIRAVEQDSSLTDRKRLDILARNLDGGGHWGTHGYGSSITRPAEILIPPGQPGHVDLGIDDDGTCPPAPEAIVHTFLEGLAIRINEDSPEHPLEIPEEYRHVLKFTDAIYDRDFRQSEDSGLNGTWGGLPAMHLCEVQSHPKTLDGWTIRGGWMAAMGRNCHTTEILYAKKDQGTPEEKALKWRVFVREGEYNFNGRWFPSIAAFLLFRSDWFSRLPEGWENITPDLASDASDDTGSEEEEEAGDSEEDDDSDSDDDWPPFKYQAFDCSHDIATDSRAENL